MLFGWGFTPFGDQTMGVFNIMGMGLTRETELPQLLFLLSLDILSPSWVLMRYSWILMIIVTIPNCGWLLWHTGDKMAILWRLNGGDIRRSNYKPIKPINNKVELKEKIHICGLPSHPSLTCLYWFCNSEYITFDELGKGCVILLTPGWFYWVPFICKWSLFGVDPLQLIMRGLLIRGWHWTRKDISG